MVTKKYLRFRPAGLYTPKQAVRSVATMLRKEIISPEVLIDLAEKFRAETKAAANNVLNESERETLRPPTTFAMAAQRLNEAGFNLEEARAEAVGMHQQWGIVKALKEKGVVKNAKEYSALFDDTMFTVKGLNNLVKKLYAGETWMPIFNPGHLLPEELWHILFTQGKIPWANEYGMKDLPMVRKINPNDIPDLKNLHKKGEPEQLNALRAAYNKASAMKPSSPSVVFTPEDANSIWTGKSAIKNMQFMEKEGVRFMDLMDNMIRWRTQYELTNLKPDDEVCTYDPLSVFPSGGVANITWSGDALYLINGKPGYDRGNLARQILA